MNADPNTGGCLARPPARASSTLRLGARRGIGAWLTLWVASQVVGSLAVGIIGGGGSTQRVQTVALASALSWTVQLTGLLWVSRTSGSNRFATDYGLRLRPVDLLGIPIGALVQFAVIPLVYLPLRAIWPDVFTTDQLERTARQLTDSATGGWLPVLVATIVVGAPIVEELLYRGLLQRSICNSAGPIVAWLATAGIFTLIHFRPYEYAGLAAFSLVTGFAAMRTRRLGPSIMIHIGFNAAGLVAALR